ncbi:MAG: hypothetical protein AB7W16_28385, partial [Candidatus Obscuribacterales bacterium]
TGRRPFLAPDLMKLMYKTVTEAAPTMSSVRPDLEYPPEVEAVVGRALSKNPAERQPSVRQFWKDFEGACQATGFGQKRAKSVVTDNIPFNQHEILPTERLMEPQPKKPQFAAGPEDMMELMMPPTPPARPADSASPNPGNAPAPPAPAPASASAPAPASAPASANRPPSPSSLAGAPAPARPSPPPPPRGASSEGVAKPPPPPAAGKPGGPPPMPQAKKPAGPPPLPASKMRANVLEGSKNTGKPATNTGASGTKSNSGSNSGTNSSPPSRPPERGNQPAPTLSPTNSREASKDVRSKPPGSTSSRLAALVKKPAGSRPPEGSSSGGGGGSRIPPAPAKAEARPPSVYSYVPPQEEKPRPRQEEPRKAPAPGTRPGSPERPRGEPRRDGRPGPAQAGRPAPGKSGPGSDRPASDRPASDRPVSDRPVSKPGGQNRPGPGASSGSASGPGSRPNSGPGSAPERSKTPAVKASAERPGGQTSSDLDGNLPTSDQPRTAKAPEDRLSKFSWDDEVEALKTGNFLPVTSAEVPESEGGTWPDGTPLTQPPPQQQPPPQGHPGHPMPPYQYWPPGQMMPGQMMPPGYDQATSYPPGMMMPGQQMPPGYDQSMSYPPGMIPYMPGSGAYPQMPPYMQPGQPMPPGYPPGQPMPQYPQGYPPQWQPGMPGQPPGMPQGVQPGMQPGVQPGVQPGMQPGVQQGMQPGMPPGAQQGMPPNMLPGMQQPPSGFDTPALPSFDDQDSSQGSLLSNEIVDSSPSPSTETSAVDEPAPISALSEEREESQSPPSVSDLFGPDETVLPGGDVLQGSADKGGDETTAPKKKGTGLGALLGVIAEDDEEEAAPGTGPGGFVDPGAPGEGFQSIDLSKGQKLFDGMKKEKDKDKALGALLDAVKEDESKIGRMPEATNPISAAVDDMFPDDTMSSAAPPMGRPGKSSARTSLNSMPEATNEIADAVDKWLDDVADGSQLGGGGAPEEKPAANLGISQAAAKLSEVLMSADGDDISSDTGSASGFAASGQPGFAAGRERPNPSTSTSDALSRLLEAANKAPESVEAGQSPRISSSREVSSLFQSSDDFNRDDRYGAQPTESSSRVREFGGNQSTGGGLPSAGQPMGEPGGVGTSSKYDQDAVARRIAELNKKLDAQSLGNLDAELPEAREPEPSILPDNASRRDVVNRIMEEHARGQQQPEEDYSQYSQQAGGFSPADLENISNNRLAAMAEAEAGRSRGKNLRSRQGRGLGFDLKTPVLALLVIGGVGYFGFTQNWFGKLPELLSGVTSMIPSGGGKGEDVAARDKEIAAEFDKFYNQGQISKAVDVLERYNDKMELSPMLGERLDKGYIALATWKGEHDARDEAVEILKLIPEYSDKYDEAKSLIKKFSKETKPSKKSSSKRRKKRR